MAEIAEPLRSARILAKPKKFPPLRSFSCGRKGQPWEKMVNEWARGLYLGTETSSQTVVVLEDAHGKLVGVCSFMRESLPVRAGGLIGTAYCIHMIGIDRLYRGKRLEDGSRLGDVLLDGALEHIRMNSDGRTPHIWSLVSPENHRSRALFDRHGFDEWRYSGEGEIIYVLRPRRRSSRARPADGKRIARWLPRRIKGSKDRGDRT
jgi:ribosomal protein S18 acetylase RimI-like enzyme